jgi:hypothetical protein
MMISCEDDPDADTVAKTYFASKAEANPPEPALLTELVDALEARFLGDQQARVEALLGQYNSFAVENSTEKVPAVIKQIQAHCAEADPAGGNTNRGIKDREAQVGSEVSETIRDAEHHPAHDASRHYL